MDGQDKQPDSQTHVPNPQPQQQLPDPRAIPTTTVVNEVGKPKVDMNDAQVQALLMLTGTEASAPQKKKLPLGLIFTIIVLVILLAMAGPLMSHVSNSSKNTNQPPAAGSTSNQHKSASQSTTDEVNNDVNSCKNVVNALSEC